MNQFTAPSSLPARKRQSVFATIAIVVMLFAGGFLMALNLYGLTQPLRYQGLDATERESLRFPDEENYSAAETRQALENFSVSENSLDTARSLNELVNKALIHVRWTMVDAATYHQLIPPWENYFLYLIGKFSSREQFNRYHFTDYKRSFERGIGMCGDAAIALDSLLEEYSFESNIIAFPDTPQGSGHVIVEFIDETGKSHLLDPDFGVDLGVGLDVLKDSAASVVETYRKAGFSDSGELENMHNVFSSDREVFDGTVDFMTQRYYFERFSYIAKWLLPLGLIALALFWHLANNRLVWSRQQTTGLQTDE